VAAVASTLAGAAALPVRRVAGTEVPVAEGEVREAIPEVSVAAAVVRTRRIVATTASGIRAPVRPAAQELSALMDRAALPGRAETETETETATETETETSTSAAETSFQARGGLEVAPLPDVEAAAAVAARPTSAPTAARAAVPAAVVPAD